MRYIDIELLTKYIHQTGLTYLELADRLSISRNTIYNILAGDTYPSTSVINIFASSLEFTQADFLATFYPKIHFKEEFSDDEFTR